MTEVPRRLFNRHRDNCVLGVLRSEMFQSAIGLWCRRAHPEPGTKPPSAWPAPAVRSAHVSHVSPTAVMKKAIPEGMAPFAPRTLSGLLREALPASEGFAFNWGPYFDGAHSRLPEGTDGGTEPHAEHTESMEFCKTLPPGARWITSVQTALAPMSPGHRSQHHKDMTATFVNPYIPFAYGSHMVRILMENRSW
jgi:hypothetical protein